MAPGSKGGRYHHGDLRAALIEAAIALISEKGVRGFSMAEASRRLGVAPSAPYAHFDDRDDLLAAVAVHACQVFQAELVEHAPPALGAAARLASLARAYVRFAGFRRPLFEVLFGTGIDKARHPEVKQAEQPIEDLLLKAVRAVAGEGQAAERLAIAVEATAHGHAMLLADGDFGSGEAAVEQAAAGAAAATLALVAGRHLLS